MSFLATTEHICPPQNISGHHRTLMPYHKTFSQTTEHLKMNFLTDI
jgi:hypothetical protein